MSIESLDLFETAIFAVKQEAKVMEESCRKASVALGGIPEPIKSQTTAELLRKIEKWLKYAAEPSPFGNPTTPAATIPDSDLPTPKPMLTATAAILDLLKSHPHGLSFRDIVNSLTGKFQTVSDKPVRVLGSVISQLKKSEQVKHVGGLYSINQAYARQDAFDEEHAQVPDSADPHGTGTCKERVIAYFKANGNKWATAGEIAMAIGVPVGSVRDLFSRRAPDEFERQQTHGGRLICRMRITGTSTQSEGLPFATEPTPE